MSVVYSGRPAASKPSRPSDRPTVGPSDRKAGKKGKEKRDGK